MSKIAAIALVLLLGCSSTPAASDGGTACTPGQSIACTGAGGCSGGQACKADGSGYEACACANVDAGIDATNDVNVSEAGDVFVPWSPSTLGSALALWLDANVGITLDSGQHVSKWADQSGNHNDAFPEGALTPPTMMTVGSKSVLHFINSCALSVADAATLQFPGDFAIEFVTLAQINSYPYSKIGPSVKGIEMRLYPQPALLIDNPYVLNQSITAAGNGNSFDGTLHVYGVRLTGTACEVRFDGVVTAGSSCSTILVHDQGPIRIGRSYDDTGASNIQLAEIVSIRGTVADADVTKLEAYFKTKYAL